MRLCGFVAAAGVAAGLAVPAAGQELVRYDWTFLEVVAGTNTPVTAPNGVVEPGEGARLVLTVTVLPGIGSPATYPPPPGPGSGTIAGLGSIFVDLIGTNAAQGSWNSFGRAPGWAVGGWTVSADGSEAYAISAGQFVLPTQTANAANPIESIVHAVWNPASYSARSVRFQSRGAVAAQGNHSSILIQYGLDPGSNPEYVGKFVAGEFGSVQIPIVPGPGASPVLLVLALGRRKRSGGRP